MPLIKWLVKLVNVTPEATKQTPKIESTPEGWNDNDGSRRNQNQKGAKKHIHQIREVVHSPASYIHRGASASVVSLWYQEVSRGTTTLVVLLLSNPPPLGGWCGEKQ